MFQPSFVMPFLCEESSGKVWRRPAVWLRNIVTEHAVHQLSRTKLKGIHLKLL